MFERRLCLGLALAAGLLAVAFGAVIAADEAPAGAKAKLKLNRAIADKIAADAAKKDGDAEKKDGDPAAEKKEGEEEKADPFKLPEGGVKELLPFLQSMMNFRPKTREEMLAYRVKGMAAMKEAARKIQAEATDEDKQLPGFSDVAGILLSSRVQDAVRGEEEDRRQLLTDLKEYFAANAEPSKYALQAASQLATGLEYGGQPQDAIGVYQELGAVLAKSPNEQIAKTGVKMEGAARRLGLVGNAMEVSGTEMNGDKFDWAKLRGKVVLVDFWATWCGPCRAELPNVKKNYDLYHDKGFEVVGISLDRDRKKLEEFLEKEQNPWITLHDGDWGDNATATYYGVMGIPTVILVDKEGKVVSTRARGPELGRLLEELLGPAEPAAAEGDKPAEEKKEEKKDTDL